MELIDEIIHTVKPIAKDYIIENVIVGLHITLSICKNKKGKLKAGIASTMPRWSPKGKCPSISSPGTFASSSADKIIDLMKSNSPQEVSVAIATINAIAQFQQIEYHPFKAQDIIEKYCSNKILAIIGHFPFLSALKVNFKKCMVFELQPSEGEYPSREIPKLLPQAEVVAITGTTFINHTIEDILNYSKNAKLRIIMGPSTPLIPQLLDFGIDILAGTFITNIELVKRYVLEGANYSQLKGKQSICITNRKIKL